jgi:hypothetical protein
VLARALKVTGMVAELEFSGNTGVDVKAKLPDGVIPTAQGGVKFGGAWEGTSKLKLAAPTPFYVAGELRRFSQAGLAGGDATAIGDLLPNQDQRQLIRR